MPAPSSTTRANARASPACWRTPIQYTPAASTAQSAAVARFSNAKGIATVAKITASAPNARDSSGNPGLAAPAQRDEEQRVDHGHRQRAPRCAVSCIADDRNLQREADQRDAEYQKSVDRILRRERSAPRVEDRDRHVESEEEDEERLHDGVVLRRIEAVAPDRAQHEREHEADRVQARHARAQASAKIAPFSTAK